MRRIGATDVSDEEWSFLEPLFPSPWGSAQGRTRRNALNLPATGLSAKVSPTFTLKIDNHNAAGTQVGGLDWRDRGDGPDAPVVRLVGNFVKNALGVVHVVLNRLPAGSYDVLGYHLDPSNPQSANIRILVTDSLGWRGTLAWWVMRPFLATRSIPVPPLLPA